MNQYAHLHIHQIVDADTTQFWELLSALFKERRNSVAFLALRNGDGYREYMYLRGQARHTAAEEPETHHDTLAMPTPVPVGVRDLDVLLLELFLLAQPFLAQLFPLPALRLLAFAVGQERGVDLGVFARLWSLYRWLVAVE